MSEFLSSLPGDQPKEYISLRWGHNVLYILDQTMLPDDEVYLDARSPEEVAQAICSMKVRGAPAIGVAAAFAIALAVKIAPSHESVSRAENLLAGTRPTARNLFWALERMSHCASLVPNEDDLPAVLEDEAIAIQKEDFLACKSIGEFGASLLPQRVRVLTHCNAGALATAGWGTALGVIRSAHELGKRVSVLSGETRPLLQGSRLTSWELSREGIPVEVISDSAAGYCMNKNLVDVVIVGADRIARNGDVVNKIGTYPLALMAQEHHVPFYVAAPLSTIDFSLSSGEEVPIEERPAEEVTCIGERRIAAVADAFNPAFDMTPARLVSAIVCEKGVIWPPLDQSVPTYEP